MCAEASGLAASLPRTARSEVEGWLRRALDEEVAARIWSRDGTLWAPAGTPEVADRLGSLDAPITSAAQVAEIEGFVAECRAEDLRDAVVLGMGGSSLAPEVLRRALGAAGDSRPADLRLTVLDSVDPHAVASVEAETEPERTLFLVSTRSGTTLETLSLARWFLARVEARLGRDEAGRRFAAITDPGSPLLALADEHGFRRVFLGDPEIGGRYSALSVFGTVPAALASADLAWLASAEEGRGLCGPERRGADNLGLHLGVVIGALARLGRDKLTLLVDEPLAGLGPWLGQLVAESEAIERAAPDRMFLAVWEPSGVAVGHARALARAGHAAIELPTAGPPELGCLFFVLEFATAVAGWVLGVNPFDQPDVEEAKARTRAVLDRTAERRGGARGGGARPRECCGGGRRGGAARPRLRACPRPAKKGPRRRSTSSPMSAPPSTWRSSPTPPPPAPSTRRSPPAVGDRRPDRRGTTFGYGPRYLHSTGQLHKGGPPTGRFLQLVRPPRERALEVPGAAYGFADLLLAQAERDLEALRARGRPAVRIALDEDPAASVERLLSALAPSPAR